MATIPTPIWNDLNDRICANYQARTRAWQLWQKSTKRVALALHPETMGWETLAWNWGNERVRAYWGNAARRWQHISSAYDARHNAIIDELRALQRG